jgi:membrane-bound inhibitor of C-type lysozyme
MAQRDGTAAGRRAAGTLPPALGVRRTGGRIAALGALGIAAASPAVAEGLPLAPPVEEVRVDYRCTGTLEALSVRYVNGAGQSFAVVPLEDIERIFVTVLSGSGARYASGPYVWWSAKDGAALYDLRRGETSDPVAECREAG